MFCPKCGKENDDENLFCASCGTKLKESEENKSKEVIAIKNKLKRRIKITNFLQLFKGKNKKKTVIVCSCCVIIICLILGGILYFNNPITKFENDIKNNNSTEALKVYDDKILGDVNKEDKIKSYLKNDITTIEKSFTDEKIEYDKAKNNLDTINQTNLVSSDVNSAINKVSSLNNSRIAFNKAEGFLKNDDYVNAIKEYKNVISDDKNYAKAKEQITNNEKKYKEQVLKNAEEFSNKQDYEKAEKLLAEAVTILPNDADIASKNIAYSKSYEDKLIKDQEVSVENVSLDKDWIDDYLVCVVVKNNTDKVVKKYSVSWMGFDSNGYPVKTGWLSPDFLQDGDGEANIQPGSTYGYGKGWKLTGGFDKTMEASKFIACVKEVEYYDGSKWTNPYYNYWKDKYLGKQYK